MKKRTWIRRIFCSLLLLVLPLAAAAGSPYSLAVHCRYEQRAVAGMELDLYRAGSLDNRGRFVPAEGFGSDSVLPESWDALADTLAELARDREPLDTRKTDTQGDALFSGLEAGAYLAVPRDEKTDYTAQPFLAALPGQDPETGAALEAVEVYPKLQKRQPPAPPTTAPSWVPGKPSRLPQTGQDWQGVCVLGLFGLGLVCGAVMTRKRIRRVTAIAGALCILGALGFVGSNLHRSTESGREAGAVLEELLPVVYANAQEATAMPPQTLAPETEPTAPVPEMPTQTVNGWDYIGYLSIPSLELTLPIQNQWSYEGFRVAPGRFAGSTYSKDLVLAAHNYPQHFGRIGDLQPGDTVCFTDMDGHVTHYRVAALETLAPEDVEGMLSGEYDLTLFTCTVGGKSRVTVRCTEA